MEGENRIKGRKEQKIKKEIAEEREGENIEERKVENRRKGMREQKKGKERTE